MKWNDPEINKAVREALDEMGRVEFQGKMHQLLAKQLDYVFEKQKEERYEPIH